MNPQMLLHEVNGISKKYELLNKKTGGYFNIFEIANISTDEVILCRVLYELLDPKGSHCQGNTYLKLFIRHVLQLDMSNKELESAKVFREYIIEKKRRIDLVIETYERFIPIEVKIFAGDQKNQCFDYYNKARKTKVYYLTCFGDAPSEYSAGGLTANEDGYDEIICISFATDILEWLRQCLKEVDTLKIASIREIILQLIMNIEKFTNQIEGGKAVELHRQILSSKENLISAIDIGKSLPKAKATIMSVFINSLTEKFISKGFEVFRCEEFEIENYYLSSKRTYPYLTIILRRFSEDFLAAFNIEITDNLYYYFTVLDAELDYTTEKIKGKNKVEYDCFVNAVNDVMECEGKSSQYTFFWLELYDSKKSLYNFKQFSNNCSELLDTCECETERMVAELSPKLFEIIDKLQ